MARAKVLGKSILLLILIIILVLFGLLWFGYLGVLPTTRIFAPVYKAIGLQPQTTTSPSSPKDMVEEDLDNDRYAKRLESLDALTEELQKREADVEAAENNNAQIAQELEDQKKAQEEREKTFNNELKKYEDKVANTEQKVQWLEGMPPDNAVAILQAMDDQDIIDIFRQAEADAAAKGSSSMVAFWISKMDSARAAQINRKMDSKPTSLD